MGWSPKLHGNDAMALFSPRAVTAILLLLGTASLHADPAPAAPTTTRATAPADPAPADPAGSAPAGSDPPTIAPPAPDASPKKVEDAKEVAKSAELTPIVPNPSDATRPAFQLYAE